MSEVAAVSGPINISSMTHYSYRNGAMKVAEAVKRAKALGATALGVMDSNLSGALDFAKTCKDAGVKPLMGVRIPLTVSGGQGDARVTQLCWIGLVAMDETGWGNLCAVLAAAEMLPAGTGITSQVLATHREGTVLLSGLGEHGLGYWMARHASHALPNSLRSLKKFWGDRFFVEIERPYRYDGQEEDEALLLAAAESESCKLIGTSDIRYAVPSQHERWMVIRANEEDRMISRDYLKREIAERGLHSLRHLRSADELQELFADLPEALLGAQELAERVSYAPAKRKSVLPPWPEATPELTEDDILRRETTSGLRAHLDRIKYIADEKPYWDRLDYELGIIMRMKFSGYFLMVSDFMRWSARNGIPLGPGRGSGAGSIVAWALGVTKLDPMRYDLLFERFLNPNRVSMPDFDVDVCVRRRGEVIRYIAERYGSERVVYIANFNELKAKGAFKLAARIVTNGTGDHMWHTDVNDINAKINDDNDKLAEKDKKNLTALVRETAETNQKFIEYEAEEQSRRNRGIQAHNIMRDLLEVGDGLLGVYNNLGVHASGIIISPKALREDGIPLIRMPDGDAVMCGYDMKSSEDAGLIKFDILGLAAVTIIDDACQLIRRRIPGFDIDDIPIDDDPTYRNFRDGLTSGVFQFESSGMRDALQKIKPNVMGDLIAAVSLYRPGPMAYIDNYAARKDGTERFEYYHPLDLNKKTLEETYGIMVYQEQIMRVAQNSAGFSLAAADEMRRAIGKKNINEITRLKNVFIHGDEANGIPGAIKLGMSLAKANELYADIEKFADYGFNKSHAAAYALVAYQTMYLKTHYPAEFLTASMSSKIDKVETLQLLRHEALQLGITILPPDINDSEMEFTCVDPLTIRYGMAVGKGISEFPADFWAIRRQGRFTSLQDFCERLHAASLVEKTDPKTGKLSIVSKSILKKNQMETLTMMGAFDSLQPNRRMALEEIKARFEHCEKLRKFNAKPPKKPKKGQVENLDLGDRSGAPQLFFQSMPEWDDVAAREHKVCGSYVTRHPLDSVAVRLQRAGIAEIEEVKLYLQNKGLAEMPAKVCGVVESMLVKKSKKGNSFLNLRLVGRNTQIWVRVFQSNNDRDNSLWTAQKEVLEESQKRHRPVVLVGNIGRDDMICRQALRALDVLGEVEAKDKVVGLITYRDSAQAKSGLGDLKAALDNLKTDDPRVGRQIELHLSCGAEQFIVPLEGLYDTNSPDFLYNVRPLLNGGTKTIPVEPNAATALTLRRQMAAAPEAIEEPDYSEPPPPQEYTPPPPPPQTRRIGRTLPISTSATQTAGVAPAAAPQPPPVAATPAMALPPRLQSRGVRNFGASLALSEQSAVPDPTVTQNAPQQTEAAAPSVNISRRFSRPAPAPYPDQLEPEVIASPAM
jgi:DNA polymerase III subunit alpha